MCFSVIPIELSGVTGDAVVFAAPGMEIYSYIQNMGIFINRLIVLFVTFTLGIILFSSSFRFWVPVNVLFLIPRDILSLLDAHVAAVLCFVSTSGLPSIGRLCLCLFSSEVK